MRRAIPLHSVRPVQFPLILVLSLGCLAPNNSDAAPKKSPKPSTQLSAPGAVSVPARPIDTGLVRRNYLDGDFDPAIDHLESALLYKSGFTHDDSVFAFKHLGVMYAAKYETREKGKRYMHKLLEVEPTARILDMYASDMIYMIFKNIQDEFDAARLRLVRADSSLSRGRGGAEDTKRDAAAMDRRKSSAPIWIGATVAVAAAAGAATWYYFSDEPDTKVNNHTPNFGN